MHMCNSSTKPVSTSEKPLNFKPSYSPQRHQWFSMDLLACGRDSPNPNVQQRWYLWTSETFLSLHLLANWNWEGGVLGTNGTWPWKKAMNKSLPCMTHKKLISFLRRCQWFFWPFSFQKLRTSLFFFSKSFQFIAPQTCWDPLLHPWKPRWHWNIFPFSIGNTVHLHGG